MGRLTACLIIATASLAACNLSHSAPNNQLGTTGSSGCSCSTECCSAQNVQCLDGTSCTGDFYCDYQSGKCGSADPCNGESGTWSCGGTTGATGSSGSTGTAGSTGTTSSSGSGSSGPIGPSGGQVASLVFGLVGDTRPDSSDDVANYPSSVIGGAFGNMAKMSPAPDFIIASGDFMYSDDSSNPSASTASQQAGLYVSAFHNSGFQGQLFPAIGNHECNTATTSNCGDGNADGTTPNYSAFLDLLSQVGLGPSPYYVVNVSSAAGIEPAWTSKFVVIACNAWDDAQSTWLQSALSVSNATTYTFIVRHETVEEDQEPGVPASPCGMATSALLAPLSNQGQITLLLTGHTHYYKINNAPTDVVSGGAPGVTFATPELVVGNTGAPLRTDATNYGADGFGYVVCSQTPDANPSNPPDIACQEYDATTGVASTAAGGAIQVTASGAIVSGGGV